MRDEAKRETSSCGATYSRVACTEGKGLGAENLPGRTGMGQSALHFDAVTCKLLHVAYDKDKDRER